MCLGVRGGREKGFIAPNFVTVLLTSKSDTYGTGWYSYIYFFSITVIYILKAYGYFQLHFSIYVFVVCMEKSCKAKSSLTS